MLHVACYDGTSIGLHRRLPGKCLVRIGDAKAFAVEGGFAYAKVEVLEHYIFSCLIWLDIIICFVLADTENIEVRTTLY